MKKNTSAEQFIDAVKETGIRLSKELSLYPWAVQVRYPAERNITTQLAATVICKGFHVLMEAPMPDENDRSCHIDLLAVTKERRELWVVEAKRLFHLTHVRNLMDDIDRLDSLDFRGSAYELKVENPTVVRAVLAMTWDRGGYGKTYREWWVDNTPFPKGFRSDTYKTLNKRLASAHRGGFKLANEGWLLYAIL